LYRWFPGSLSWPAGSLPAKRSTSGAIGLGFLEAGQEEVLVQRLADDLASGAWDRQYGHYRMEPTFICALRLIIAMP